MTFPYAVSVTLLRRTVTGEDGYGNDVLTSAPTVVAGCVVWPRGSSEATEGQDQITTGLTALLPAGTDVTAVDAVQILGDPDTYEIDGTPNVYVNPFTGADPGVEINLKKVTG